MKELPALTPWREVTVTDAGSERQGCDAVWLSNDNRLGQNHHHNHYLHTTRSQNSRRREWKLAQRGNEEKLYSFSVWRVSVVLPWQCGTADATPDHIQTWVARFQFGKCRFPWLPRAPHATTARPDPLTGGEPAGGAELTTDQAKGGRERRKRMELMVRVTIERERERERERKNRYTKQSWTLRWRETARLKKWTETLRSWSLKASPPGGVCVCVCVSWPENTAHGPCVEVSARPVLLQGREK